MSFQYFLVVFGVCVCVCVCPGVSHRFLNEKLSRRDRRTRGLLTNTNDTTQTDSKEWKMYGKSVHFVGVLVLFHSLLFFLHEDWRGETIDFRPKHFIA